MYLKINNMNIYYEVIGNGAPLIMLHGNGEDHNIFMEVANILKDHYTCYLIDSRDHGLSQSVDKLSYLDMAEDIKAFIKELELHNVILYGFSDGGIIGLLVASQISCIQTLIISGANLNPNGVSWRLKCYLRIYNMFKRDKKIQLMLEEPWISDEDLQNITANTLIIAGERDLIKLEHTKHIAENIKNSELMILPNETHGSYIIHNTKIADLIQNYLKSED